MKALAYLFPFLMSLLVLGSSCDQLDEDMAPQAGYSDQNGGLTVFASPGGPTIINLLDRISSPAPFSIQITSPPQLGQVQVDANGFLLYRNNKPFTEGNDYIGYSIIQEGHQTTSGTLQIIRFADATKYPCYAGAMYDSLAILTNATAAEIPVLGNDLICSGTTQTVTLSKAPAGKISWNGSNFLYTPLAGYTGKDYFIYQLCEQTGYTTDGGLSASCTYAYVHLEVMQKLPDCPFSAYPDTFVLAKDTTASTQPAYISLNVLANDRLCGGILAAITISAPQQGQAYIENNTIYYQRPKGFTGKDYFTYKICDTSGSCSESNISITCL